MDIEKFWRSILKQDEDEIRAFFHRNAYVNWHCTNEHFTLDEFIRANCEYPGQWDGEIERVHQFGDLVITAVRVFTKDLSSSFHVTSFIALQQDKIAFIDEYWGDDGMAPRWRLDKRIGRAINPL